MEREEMDLQKLSYFTEGNTFTGSRTKEGEKKALLRYLVKPDRENSRLLAWSWTEDLCFEKAQERREADFPLDEEGLDQVRDWLWEQFQGL